MEAAGVPLRGTRVLELGSNLGMNLIELRGELAWGIGVDVNPLAVNQANYLARLIGVEHDFRFFYFDINKEPNDMLATFLPNESPRGGAASGQPMRSAGDADVVFMFSVNAYIDDMNRLLDALQAIAPVLVIELNEKSDNVAAIERLRQRLLVPRFTSVIELTNYTACPDCHLNKGRLFACISDVGRRHLHAACVNSSELELQTAMQRYVQQPTTKLDHYVSVQVDRRPKPAATNPWRERQMAAWRARVIAERSG